MGVTLSCSTEVNPALLAAGDGVALEGGRHFWSAVPLALIPDALAPPAYTVKLQLSSTA